jgi:hypothetical protein
MKRSIVCAVLLIMGLAPLASAQEDSGESIVWLALETTKSGQSRNLISQAIKYDGPMYDELLANGSLESWGIAIPINHSPNDTFNYMLWATMPSWKEVGDLQAGFEKLFSTRSPEEMAKGQQAYAEATVSGAHHDLVGRHHIRQYGNGEVQPRYLVMSYWKAHPGKDDQLTSIFKKSVAPIFQSLVDNGTIQGYGITTQELHTDPGWSHISWTAIADLSAMDAIDEALMSGLTPVDFTAFSSISDWQAHHDQIMLIVHFGGTKSE